jgi:hypothetical protein
MHNHGIILVLIKKILFSMQLTFDSLTKARPYIILNGK